MRTELNVVLERRSRSEQYQAMNCSIANLISLEARFGRLRGTESVNLRIAISQNKILIQWLRMIERSFSVNNWPWRTTALIFRVLGKLVGIRAHDALSFSLAWILMTLVALVASTIPASQAARTDLISVLHSE
jgi:hypothetical protein